MLGDEVDWRPAGRRQSKTRKPSRPPLGEIRWEQANAFKQALEAIPAVREVWIWEAIYEGNPQVNSLIVSGQRWISTPRSRLSPGHYEELAFIDPGRPGIAFHLHGDGPLIPVSGQEMFEHLKRLPGPADRAKQGLAAGGGAVRQPRRLWPGGALMKRLISALRRLLRWLRDPTRENHRRLRRSIRRQLIGAYRHQNLRILLKRSPRSPKPQR